MSLSLIIVILIIIFIYMVRQTINKPEQIAGQSIKTFLIDARWLHNYNVLEWNRLLRLVDKFSNESDYDKAYTLSKTIINIFHSFIHSMSSSTDMNLFNSQLDMLTDLMNKSMTKMNRSKKLSQVLQPITDQSQLSLITNGNLLEDPRDPNINLSYDWKA